MTRQRTGSIITGIAAAGFLGTAILHSTGYGAILRLAEQAPAELQVLAPAMWLVFSFDLAILGLIVAVVAVRPSAVGRLVLVLAALCPLSAAGLQLRFLGFIPPTGLLLMVGGLTLIGAAVLPGATGADRPQ